MRACALLLIMWMALFPAGASDALPVDWDQRMAAILTRFQVPGVGLAIVKDGQVVLAKGYGVRELGKPAEVDEQTLFGIASNTKAFTAAALAILIDEGKLDWDDKVVDLLPNFRLYDPYATAELTVKDLLVHRSGLGLGAGDLLYFPPSDYSVEEIAYRLRFIKPANSFRATYNYDNALYLIAGLVVEKVSGMSWHAFVRSRIFDPLGMKRACTRIPDMAKDANHVMPHAVLEGILQPVALEGLDSVAPAGAINACVAELTAWVKAQLAKGALGDGENAPRLFSEDRSREMHTGVTPINSGEPPAELAASRSNFRAYALGWDTRDYRGKKMVYHNGGLLGQISKVSMLPELNLGVIVLTNQQAGGICEAITFQLFDHYLGVTDGPDWAAAFDTVIKRRNEERQAEESARDAARNAAVGPSLPLASYVGTYTDAWYGDIAIALEGEKLTMAFSHTPSLSGAMEHYQYDTFLVRWHDRSLEADAFVTFSLTPEGKIREMQMKPVSAKTDFSFDFQDLLFHPAP